MRGQDGAAGLPLLPPSANAGISHKLDNGTERANLDRGMSRCSNYTHLGKFPPLKSPLDQSFVYGTEMPFTPSLISLAPRQLPAGGFGVLAVPCTRCTPRCRVGGEGQRAFLGSFPSSEGFQGRDGASAPWGPGEWGWMSAPAAAQGILGVLVVQGAPEGLGFSVSLQLVPIRSPVRSCGCCAQAGFYFCLCPTFQARSLPFLWPCPPVVFLP